MGVQGTQKSAEALHEIFMGNFLFLSSFLSRHRSEKASKPHIEYRKHVEMAAVGLPLTFWGRDGQDPEWILTIPSPLGN